MFAGPDQRDGLGPRPASRTSVPRFIHSITWIADPNRSTAGRRRRAAARRCVRRPSAPSRSGAASTPGSDRPRWHPKSRCARVERPQVLLSRLNQAMPRLTESDNHNWPRSPAGNINPPPAGRVNLIQSLSKPATTPCRPATSVNTRASQLSLIHCRSTVLFRPPAASAADQTIPLVAFVLLGDSSRTRQSSRSRRWRAAPDCAPCGAHRP